MRRERSWRRLPILGVVAFLEDVPRWLILCGGTCYWLESGDGEQSNLVVQCGEDSVVAQQSQQRAVLVGTDAVRTFKPQTRHTLTAVRGD